MGTVGASQLNVFDMRAYFAHMCGVWCEAWCSAVCLMWQITRARQLRQPHCKYLQGHADIYHPPPPFHRHHFLHGYHPMVRGATRTGSRGMKEWLVKTRNEPLNARGLLHGPKIKCLQEDQKSSPSERSKNPVAPRGSKTQSLMRGSKTQSLMRGSRTQSLMRGSKTQSLMRGSKTQSL